MADNSSIPFLDLVTPHRELEEELLSEIRGILRTAEFVGGRRVEEFENDFARFCGTDYCVGVANGTDALRFALIACGVHPGDTVVTVPNTFIATTEAVSQAGAHPDFVDIQEQGYSMDPQKLAEYLERQCRREPSTGKLYHKKTGRRVTAVIPVHLHGLMADLDPILALAAEYNLMVIEDACQAHGAEYFSGKYDRWSRAGSLGRAAAFSFYPAKNLGACGEAGAVTTSDRGIAEKVRMLRDHGQVKKYCHEIEGYNGRLDAIQAAILGVKLRHLPTWNAQRRANARRYTQLFVSAGVPITVPFESPRVRPVYHVYAIRVQDRDALQGYLARANITTQIHYPGVLHLQKAYEHLGFQKGNFPIAEAVAAEILSLPLYPHLQPDQQKRIVCNILEFMSTAPSSATTRQTVSLPEYRIG